MKYLLETNICTHLFRGQFNLSDIFKKIDLQDCSPLAQASRLCQQRKTASNKLKGWNERILSGVATKFGKNSSQDEMVSGTEKSERKKPTPKKPS